MTGGYGQPDKLPCNKRDMTIPLMLQYKEEGIHEKGIFEADGRTCGDGF